MGGRLFLAIVLLLAVLKTASLMRRPGTSGLCVSSLLLFFCGWLMSVLVAGAAEIWGFSRVMSMAGGLLVSLFFLISIILAVAGLVVWRHHRGEYQQGKSQAIWALVLSGLMLVMVVGAAVMAMARNMEGSSPSVAQSGPGPEFLEMKEYGDRNFRLAQPVRPWISMPPGKIVPDALSFYSRANPELYLAVISETNVGLTRRDVLAFLLARLEGLSSKLEKLPEESFTFSGLTFTKAPVRVNGIKGVASDIYYEYWIACSGSVTYQFNFWSSWKDRQKLSTDALAWMKTFTLIQPVPDVAEPDIFKDHESPGEGYVTKGLAEAGWVPETEAQFPEAHLCVKRGSDRLALVALPLPDWSKIRTRDLDNVLLGTMNLTEAERPAEPLVMTHQGVEGREYAFDRKLEELTYRFRARILQRGNMAWMLVTWGFKSDPEEFRTAAAESVKLFVPEPGAKERELTPELSKARAFFLNDLGIAHYQRQEFREASAFFRLARPLLPQDASIAGNELDALEQQGKPEAALEMLDKEIPQEMRTSVKMRARRAQLLVRTGDNTGAAKEWSGLFGEGYQNEDHLLAWINLLLEMDRKTDALTSVETYAKEHPSRKLHRWTASVLARNDRYDEALGLLEKQTSAISPDTDALYLQGELENDAGRYEEAGRTAGRLVAAGENTARAHMIMGWSEWHRKAWKAAGEAFARAAEKSPEDNSIKEAIAMTDGALGQGTAELSRTPLEAVPLPKALETAMAAAPELPEDLVKGQGAFYGHRLTGVFYQSGKPVRVTQYYQVKILDQKGLEAFSSLSQTFHPSSEKIYVNQLVVKDENGKVIQEGSNADAFSTGESGDLATGAEVLQVPVPGLRRGCTLEAVITVEDKSKSTKAPFRRDFMAGAFPALARAWFLTGDVKKVRFAHSARLQSLESADSRAFVIFHTPGYRRESFMAPMEKWHPWVIAGPGGDDWKQLSMAYLKRIGDRLEPDESTKALAEKICRGLSSPEEKMGAIIRYVQSTLTYKGLEFGTRGQVPSPVSKIQTDKYGDCKDHTLLLYHLLRRAGIPCSPALVDTGWTVQRDIPSLDQFDHMILHVPGAGKQPWIDATEDWLDLPQYVPDGLGGREALVLDEKAPRFEKILPPPSTDIRIARQAAIGTGGNLAVDETLTLTGAAASWARGWFLDSPQSEYVNLVRRQLDSYGLFELSEVELTHAEDQSKPLVIRMKYVVPDAVAAESRQVVLPFFWERDYLAVSPAESRLSPFRISPAMRVESVTRISGADSKIPEGYPVSAKLTEGQWEVTVVRENDETVVRLGVECQAGDFPVADWSKFQQARRLLTERLKRVALMLP